MNDLIELLFTALARGETVRVTLIISLQKPMQVSVQAANEVQLHAVTCDKCGWNRSYMNLDSAKRGLRTHQSRHCTAIAREYGWINRRVE